MGRGLEEYDPDLLVQATAYDRQALWQELWQLAETQINPPLRQLVLHLLESHREEFLVTPAARSFTTPTSAACWNIPGSSPATPWPLSPSIPI